MSKLTIAVSADDHIQGSPTAPCSLVEYGDYQCPYCGAAYPMVKQLQKHFGKRLSFVFRNFPLTQMHPWAEPAAEVAEFAGANGKFWEMHDLLYENQDALEDEDLARYAKALKLDMPRFIKEMESHHYSERVRGDFSSGVRSGVNGTPSFFINGARHDGPFDLASLLAAIKEAA